MAGAQERSRVDLGERDGESVRCKKPVDCIVVIRLTGFYLFNKDKFKTAFISSQGGQIMCFDTENPITLDFFFFFLNH